MKQPLFGLWLCIVALALPLSSQTVLEDKPVWKGKSGPFAVEWSHALLRATRLDTKQTVFDAHADALAAWEKIMQRSQGTPVSAEFTYRLLSAEGPYLTIEEEEYCDCGGAHPTAVKKFRAIQLDRSGPTSSETASLIELFPPDAIFQALVSDTLVRKALHSDAQPRSLSELLEQLADENVKVGECEYSFSPHLINSFAFYELKPDSVLMRLGLPAAVESCRGRLTQIGLTLPFSKANPIRVSMTKDHEGLLMEQALRLERESVTSFKFSRGKRP